MIYLAYQKNWHKFLKVPFLTKASVHYLFFSANDNPSKAMKNDFYSTEKAVSFWGIKIFVSASFFYTFQIQKDKRKGNSSWCHELAYIS